MKLRWISAGVGIPIFVAICVWGPKQFTVCILCVAVLGLIEMVKTYHGQGIQPNLFLAAGGLVGPAWAFRHSGVPVEDYLAILVTLVLMGILWEVGRAASTGEILAARNTAYGLLCALYIALFSGLPALRSWGGVVQNGPFQHIMNSARSPVGLGLVIVAACCVWATDSAAFFVGKYLGRRKLAPALSPAKTVEGALGGAVGGIIIGAIWGWWFLGSCSTGLLIGVAAGIFGQAGDLFESALKREAGVKDFGKFMPGHGGVMDRFDSLLIVAPLVWLLVWLRHGV